MYTLLILFFVSLAGIIIMIWRKLGVATNGQVIEKEYEHPFVPHLQKVKHLTFEGTKKYSHLTLVEVLRLYIRTSNLAKHTYEEVKVKIKNKFGKDGSRLNGDLPERQVSKFLKRISDYKHKIREIKHRIHEEEKNS